MFAKSARVVSFDEPYTWQRLLCERLIPSFSNSLLEERLDSADMTARLESGRKTWFSWGDRITVRNPNSSDFNTDGIIGMYSCVGAGRDRSGSGEGGFG